MMAFQGHSPRDTTNTAGDAKCRDSRTALTTEQTPWSDDIVSPSGGLKETCVREEVADRDSRSLLVECPWPSVTSWRDQVREPG